MLIGALGGLSLSLSLRRYLPMYFGTFSAMRFMAEMVMISGLSYAMAMLGVNQIQRKDEFVIQLNCLI
jgi:hypothetical protein